MGVRSGLLPDDSNEAVFIHAAQLRESAPRLFALRAGQRHLIAAMQQCIAVMQQASVIPLVYQNI
jgi:6-phosphogluconolactonase (cycloisomerase 2 family)